MATRWHEIKEAIFDLADSMAPPSYNYDWDTGRRVDRDYEAPTFILERPVGSPFESDVSNLGGVSTRQWRKRRRVNFVGRIPSDLAEVIDEDITDKMDDALDKALEDILSMFNGTIYSTLCEKGVKIIKYINAVKRPLSSDGVYYPHELVVTFDIDYVQQR